MTARDEFQDILDWMIDNLAVTAGVYRTTKRCFSVDPALRINERGRVTRTPRVRPARIESWCLGAVAGLVACSYVDALGRVVLGGVGSKQAGFGSFLATHMEDFTRECAARGASYSHDALWGVYRRQFVYRALDSDVVLARRGRQADYWFEHEGRPGLNIDRLVSGTIKGMKHFTQTAHAECAAGRAAYEDYLRWLSVYQ